MPIDLENLKSKKAAVTLYGGQLTVEYRLHGPSTEDVTARDEENDGLSSTEATRRNISDFVSNRLLSWNLLDGGKPVPLEPEVVLAKVPFSVMLDIIQAVNEELSPNVKRGRT